MNVKGTETNLTDITGNQFKTGDRVKEVEEEEEDMDKFKSAKDLKALEDYDSIKGEYDLVGFLLTCKKMMHVIEEDEEIKTKALKAAKLGAAAGGFDVPTGATTNNKLIAEKKKLMANQITLSEDF